LAVGYWPLAFLSVMLDFGGVRLFGSQQPKANNQQPKKNGPTQQLVGPKKKVKQQQ